MNRTKRATRNVVISFLGYICVVLGGFLTRTVIIKYIGIEMVGIGQVFSNILSKLSYTNLGLDAAMVFALYKPIADNNEKKIRAIMDFYKWCFRILSLCILLFTLVLLPITPYLIDSTANIKYVYLILFLYGLEASSSYFWAYKRSIVVASQNRYLSSLVTDVASIIKLILQVVIVVVTQNYILYLLTYVILIIGNIYMSCWVNKMYPHIKECEVGILEKEERKELTRNMFALIEQKLGMVIIFAISSILMSIYLGVTAVGIYANYLMVINGLQTAIAILFYSVTAGIGDIAVVEGQNRLKETWKMLNFLSFWIHSFSAVCLFVLLNPFITIWLGEEYIYQLPIVFLIVFHFYILGMRKPVITCKDAIGMQWNDRWKPLAEAVLNILLSIMFTKKFGGMIGILLGMCMSMLLTSCWIEPFMLYKYGLHEKVRFYYIDFLRQIGIMLLMGAVTFACTSLVGNRDVNIYSFVLKVFICLFVPNLVFVALFAKNKEFRDIVNIVKALIGDILKRNK